jgi:hypothetical protein
MVSGLKPLVSRPRLHIFKPIQVPEPTVKVRMKENVLPSRFLWAALRVIALGEVSFKRRSK